MADTPTTLGLQGSGILGRARSGGCFPLKLAKLQYGKQLGFLRSYKVCLCYVKEELGISDEFNKAGMQACVEYVEAECLSLPAGKSSYNLSAAEQLIWAP